MSEQSFLCEHCNSCMCLDCISIAEEYQELYENNKNALYDTRIRAEKLERRLARAERKARMFEQVAKAGVGDIVGAWIDKEIDQIMKESN